MSYSACRRRLDCKQAGAGAARSEALGHMQTGQLHARMQYLLSSSCFDVQTPQQYSDFEEYHTHHSAATAPAPDATCPFVPAQPAVTRRGIIPMQCHSKPVSSQTRVCRSLFGHADARQQASTRLRGQTLAARQAETQKASAQSQLHRQSETARVQVTRAWCGSTGWRLQPETRETPSLAT
jgi:hypothetical protein